MRVCTGLKFHSDLVKFALIFIGIAFPLIHLIKSGSPALFNAFWEIPLFVGQYMNLFLTSLGNWLCIFNKRSSLSLPVPSSREFLVGEVRVMNFWNCIPMLSKPHSWENDTLKVEEIFVFLMLYQFEVKAILVQNHE